ncbi:hypothetical protein PHLCEN_2v7310 [Hermanssonia centrifuga]|uniref:C2H2-type domain-containing protein n=1 Tax=Hermanssonia centrifuga TaxID=98765 RepID=A0A2R6NX19_9APHY|nr:hypothetical protein PHLCEN_2v7310 [Hermanssonia centrifuga]
MPRTLSSESPPSSVSFASPTSPTSSVSSSSSVSSVSSFAHTPRSQLRDLNDSLVFAGIYQCNWNRCVNIYRTYDDLVDHLRSQHLNADEIERVCKIPKRHWETWKRMEKQAMQSGNDFMAEIKKNITGESSGTVHKHSQTQTEPEPQTMQTEPPSLPSLPLPTHVPRGPSSPHEHSVGREPALSRSLSHSAHPPERTEPVHDTTDTEPPPPAPLELTLAYLPIPVLPSLSFPLPASPNSDAHLSDINSRIPSVGNLHPGTLPLPRRSQHHRLASASCSRSPASLVRQRSSATSPPATPSATPPITTLLSPLPVTLISALPVDRTPPHSRKSFREFTSLSSPAESPSLPSLGPSPALSALVRRAPLVNGDGSRALDGTPLGFAKPEPESEPELQSSQERSQSAEESGSTEEVDGVKDETYVVVRTVLVTYEPKEEETDEDEFLYEHDELAAARQWAEGVLEAQGSDSGSDVQREEVEGDRIGGQQETDDEMEVDQEPALVDDPADSSGDEDEDESDKEDPDDQVPLPSGSRLPLQSRPDSASSSTSAFDVELQLTQDVGSPAVDEKADVMGLDSGIDVRDQGPVFAWPSPPPHFAPVLSPPPQARMETPEPPLRRSTRRATSRTPSVAPSATAIHDALFLRTGRVLRCYPKTMAVALDPMSRDEQTVKPLPLLPRRTRRGSSSQSLAAIPGANTAALSTPVVPNDDDLTTNGKRKRTRSVSRAPTETGDVRLKRFRSGRLDVSLSLPDTTMPAPNAPVSTSDKLGVDTIPEVDESATIEYEGATNGASALESHNALARQVPEPELAPTSQLLLHQETFRPMFRSGRLDLSKSLSLSQSPSRGAGPSRGPALPATSPARYSLRQRTSGTSTERYSLHQRIESMTTPPASSRSHSTHESPGSRLLVGFPRLARQEKASPPSQTPLQTQYEQSQANRSLSQGQREIVGSPLPRRETSIHSRTSSHSFMRPSQSPNATARSDWERQTLGEGGGGGFSQVPLMTQAPYSSPSFGFDSQ